ncbi:MAG: efflux RND transporter permease subunit, partial [Myxococcota bacterium]|nr:efflux RND transporter permease subunit [Myxococcota bacterium]
MSLPERKPRGLAVTLLQRPVGVSMSAIAAILVGLISLSTLPMQLLPSGFDPPFMWLTIPTFPASPEENETLIAEPVENAISTLGELEKIRSWVRGESVSFGLRLYPNADVDLTWLRLKARLAQTLPKLPPGARFAQIWRHDPNNQPTLVIGIELPAGVGDPARFLQRALIEPLERLPGVSQARLEGISQKDLRIRFDQDALESHGITPEQLQGRLQETYFTRSLGVLEDEGGRLPLRAIARPEDVDALAQLPIAEGLRLRDVATVQLAPPRSPSLSRVNLNPAATLVIYKASTANTISVTEEALAQIERAQAADPELARFRTTVLFNQGLFIKNSLQQLGGSALFGALCAVAFLFFFLRSLQLTLLVTGAIPLCLLVTLAALTAQGESLNLLSMMGLILAVGMVVDNAIVVLEEIHRRRSEGATLFEAATQGVRAVALAITLATLTTIVVFLPLFFGSENPMMSFFMIRIGVPVCVALTASLFVALIHLPTLSIQIGSGRPAPEGRLLQRMGGGYRRLLAWVLCHRLKSTAALLLVLMSVAIPSSWLKRSDQGGDLNSTINIHLRGPSGGDHALLSETARRIEGQLWRDRDVLDLRAVRVRQGWSREHAVVECYLKTGTHKLSPEARQKKIQALLPNLPGFQARIGWQRGRQQGEITVALQGPNFTETEALARQLQEVVERVEGIDRVELDTEEIGLELALFIDRELAAQSATTPALIGAALNGAYQSRPIGEFQGLGRRVELILEPRTPPSQSGLRRFSLQGVNPAPEMETGGAGQARTPRAPLKRLSRQQLRPRSGLIRRQKGKVEVELKLSGEEDGLVERVSALLNKLELPPGFFFDGGERIENQQSNESGGLQAVLVGTLLVFCLMGLLFESLLLPLSILLPRPLAFVGVIWLLALTGTPLEIMAIIGCVLLVGIVVNNGIVLIDQVQQRRRGGEEREGAVLNAASARLRPILMTACTTIAGLVPMALSERGGMVGIDYAPLGRAVVGGLMSSTLLTLIAVPLFYTLL